MDFSIIICTYNRAGNLRRCLEPFVSQQEAEDLEWEILVVDNNSSDDTRAVVEALQAELPLRIRYVFEPEQGLNYARNRGVDESQGRCFAFVDDDILVSERWLCSIYKTFVDNDADAVGSCIHLDESIHLPKWINRDMYGFLGYQDYGDTPFQMDGFSQYPFGGNMSFNRRVVERIGYFNPKLGRKGSGRKVSELFKGAETDYFHRLAEAGGRIFYTPDAVVYHRILPFQLQKRYFRTIHFTAGYQRAYYDGNSHPRTLLGVPWFMYRHFLAQIGKYLRELVARGPDAAFRQQMNIGYDAGMLLGYFRSRSNG